jgi:hypothetical protein
VSGITGAGSRPKTRSSTGAVTISTKIKIAADRTGTKAVRVAARLNEPQEACWRSLADGRAVDQKRAYGDAVKIARSLGLDYLPPAEAAQQPIAEILTRIETLLTDGRIENAAVRKGRGRRCR